MSINLKEFTSPHFLSSTSCDDTIIQDETKPPVERAENIHEDKEHHEPWHESWVWGKTVPEQQVMVWSANVGLHFIATAWKMKTKINPNGQDKNVVTCHLHCDQCCHSGMMLVIVGNEAYVHCLWNTQDLYSTQFIAEFMIIVQHDTHMSTSSFKTEDWVIMVFTPHPNEPIKEALGYGDTMHFVSVVFNTDHFAVLYYNFAKCTVTVFDGLNATMKNWQEHFIHTLKTYGMQLPDAYEYCKFQEYKGHDEHGRKTRDMELEICFKDTISQWLVTIE